MKRTMYSVRTMHISCNHYDLENTVEVCYTRWKLWAHIRQIIACWRMPPDHSCILVVCRPSIDKWDLDGSCSGHCENCNEMVCCED